MKKRGKNRRELEKHFVAVNGACNIAMKNLDEFSDSLDAEVKAIERRSGRDAMRVPRARSSAVTREAPDCVTRGSGTRRETGSGG